MPKSFVEVRIIKPGAKANTFTSARQTRFVRDGEDLGLAIVCRIRVRGRSLDIEPEALLLMHQCHLRTEISFNP
jgi:hypothetical protein